jgi:hypothetical protein
VGERFMRSPIPFVGSSNLWNTSQIRASGPTRSRTEYQRSHISPSVGLLRGSSPWSSNRQATRAATVGRHWNECRPFVFGRRQSPVLAVSGVPFELRAEPISIADMDRMRLFETAQSSAGVRRVVAVAAQRFNDCPLLGEGALAYGDMALSLGHPGECQSSVHGSTIPDISRRPGTIAPFVSDASRRRFPTACVESSLLGSPHATRSCA